MNKITALLSVVMLAGCSTTLDKRDHSGLKTTAGEVRLGGVVMLSEECPTAQPDTAARVAFLPALAGVLASTGSQFAVDAIENSIKKYEEGLSGFFLASSTTENMAGVKLGVAYKCMVISYGLLGELQDNVAPTDGRLNQNILSALDLADYPAFYLELKITEEKDTEEVLGYSFTPQYLSYAESIALNKGSGKKHVTVALAFSENTLEVQEESDTIATKENTIAITYNTLGRLEVGKRYEGKSLSGTQSRISKFDNKSFTINVIVADSEKAGIALTAAKSAFEANKDSLKSELEKLIKDALDIDEDEET